MNTRYRFLAHVLAVTALTAVAGCDDDPVVDQSHKRGRRAYEEQAAGWTRWALEQPHSTSPIADTTGELCGSGQPDDDVWYLAGTFGGPVERTCTIPADRYIFFPLVNQWCINPLGTEYELPEDEFIETFTGFFEEVRAANCGLTLRIDGEDVLGTEREELDEALYVDVTEPVSIDINADNWTEGFYAGGPTPTLINGHFALLRPLDPGEHVIEFGGVQCDAGEVYFETSAVYHLTVEE